MTKIFVSGQWYNVEKEEHIEGTVHFWVSGRDTGGNPYAGWIPFWLIEDIDGLE